MFDMHSCHTANSDFAGEAENEYFNLILIYIHNLLKNPLNYYKINEGDDLQHVRNIVFNSLHMDWTLEKMAAMANLSVSGFRKKYKEIYGKSPIEDVYDYRFIQASRLIEAGFSIKHILKSCGFKSAQHFSNFFKKRAGITPSEYKMLYYKN